MRVLHVISGIDPHFGGPGLSMAGLAQAQSAAGLKVAVAATYYGEVPRLASLDKLRDQGDEVRLVGPARGLLHRHPAIGPLLERMVAAVDVVHIHALWDEMQCQAARVARAASVPYLFKPCGMLDPWCLAQRRWRKILYLRLRLKRWLDGAAALHFTSRTEQRLAMPLGLEAPAIVESNGVDLKEFENLPARGGFRARFPSIGSRPLVLFLSRVHPKKGLDLLVPAFVRVEPKDAMLVIAGPEEDGYGTVVRRVVEQHGLGHRVLFCGMLHGSERVAALADADLFVLPSYQENFGTVVVEALAAGVPVVISDQVNIHEEIAAARVGSVVRTEADELASAITHWLGNEPMRKATGKTGRAFAFENYSWIDVARRWKSSYQTLHAIGGSGVEPKAHAVARPSPAHQATMNRRQ
jgi:glycosyltransferase involved in cell wall biosynthesis